MALCDYGCGQEAVYVLSNGKGCCSEKYRKCPEHQRKFKEACKDNRWLINANNVKVNCRYCQHETNRPAIKKHERHCYLNPANLKRCVVCGEPIKNWKDNTTCSYACANTYFRSGEDNPNYKEQPTSSSTICFRYHEHRCIICGEENVVAVHHFDENHDNNDPSNLIPLCLNHHQYWHSRFRGLVYDRVVEYKRLFEERMQREDDR